MNNQTVVYFISKVNRSGLNFFEKKILSDRLKGICLEKIGKKSNLSGERIRQIEKQSLIKLSKPTKQLGLFINR